MGIKYPSFPGGPSGGVAVFPDLDVDEGTLSVDETNNRIGIRTITPGAHLDIHDTTTSSANTGGHLRLSANDGAVMGDSHRLGVVEFTGAEDSSGTQVVGARIEALTDAAWTNVENGTALYFYTTDADADQSLVLKIDSEKRASFSGNLGVGTTNPGAQFEVKDTTTTSANTGGSMRLSSDDSAPMGDSHRLGVIEFAGAEDSSGTQTVGARIEAMTDAAWTNAENGAALYFYTTDGNASQTNVLKLDSNLKATFAGNIFTDGSVVLKEKAAANADIAAYGQLWVKNEAPCELYFTNDAGDDIQLTSAASNAGGGGANNDMDLVLHMQVFS